MVTLGDIAKKANVSLSTVSYVLNDRHTAVRISDRTRQRVMDAAGELGYRRNAIARAMVDGHTRVLGFLRHHVAHEEAALKLEGVLDEAGRAGYAVQVVPCRFTDRLDQEAVAHCVEMRLAGVVAIHINGGVQRELHEGLARYDIPTAMVDNNFPQDFGIRVAGDDLAAMESAVAHLADELGHRRIALIGLERPETSGVATERERGYREAMARRGLKPWEPLPRSRFYDDERTEAAVRVLLGGRAADERPTAILCLSDMMGLVVCRTVRRLGLSVPDDVSVVGYDDVPMAQRCDPPLTTLAQPFAEMGRAAVRHLLAAVACRQGRQMEGEKEFSPDIAVEELLPVRLVIRESTAAAPESRT
jgi:LacI family transcriptional regulator